MSTPPQRPAPNSRDDHDQPTRWTTTALLHVALGLIAVAIAWTTVGGDADQAVQAAGPKLKTKAPAPQVESTQAPTPTPARPTTLPTATPAPAVSPVSPKPQVSADTASPTPVTPILPVLSDHADSKTEPSPASASAGIAPQRSTPAQPEAPALAAIPEPGQPWPVREAVPAATDPHLTFGRVYGLPGATRIVYLVDASGSLIDTLPFVQAELQQGLRSLRSSQSFAVIFFRDGQVDEVPPVGMKPADARAITHAVQWIDPLAGRVIASGRPGAEAAIRRALAYQPDAVVIISPGLTPRGADPLAHRAQLLTLIDTANTHRCVFHTVQLRDDDPLAGPGRRGTLQTIARHTGGLYRFVPEDELISSHANPR